MDNQERKAVNKMLARNNELVETNVKLLEALKGIVDMQFYTHEDAEIMRDIAVEAVKQAEG